MKDVIKTMLEHPFASIFILGAIGGMVSDIIRSIRSTGPKTVITFGKVKKPEPKEEN